MTRIINSFHQVVDNGQTARGVGVATSITLKGAPHAFVSTKLTSFCRKKVRSTSIMALNFSYEFTMIKPKHKLNK